MADVLYRRGRLVEANRRAREAHLHSSTDDVPTQWKDYTAANAEFFDDLGSPGGAAKQGLIAKDAAIVSALEPQEHEGH